MTVDQLQFYWNIFIGILRWTVPIALWFVLTIQISYWAFLRITIGRDGGGGRRVREPSEPIMPTRPGDTINYSRGAGELPDGQRDLAISSSIVVPKMIILSGLPNVTEIKLPVDLREFGVGRFYNQEHNIMIALDERSISRRHSTFRADAANKEYYLWDMSSSYGTSIRRGEVFEPLTPGEEQRIFNGDVIKFGSAVTVRFVLPGDTRAYATQV